MAGKDFHTNTVVTFLLLMGKTHFKNETCYPVAFIFRIQMSRWWCLVIKFFLSSKNIHSVVVLVWGELKACGGCGVHRRMDPAPGAGELLDRLRAEFPCREGQLKTLLGLLGQVGSPAPFSYLWGLGFPTNGQNAAFTHKRVVLYPSITLGECIIIYFT